MIYHEAINIDKLNTGDLIYVHRPLSFNPATWLSWAIRFFTKSYFNHTDVVLKIYGKVYVIGAIGRGVVIIPWDRWIKKHPRVFTIQKTKENVSESSLLNLSGLLYDKFTLLVSFPIYIIWKWISGKEFWLGPTGNESEEKVVCSELAAIIHNLNNSHKWTTKDLIDHFDHKGKLYYNE